MLAQQRAGITATQWTDYPVGMTLKQTSRHDSSAHHVIASSIPGIKIDYR